MSRRSANSQIRRAFRSVWESGKFPATAVIPSTSSSSDAPNANRIATASSRPGSVSMMIWRGILCGTEFTLPPHHQQFLDLGDGFGWIEVFRAGAGAVHDRVAAIEPERVLEIVEPLAGFFVAAVCDPAIGLQQHRWAEVALAVPPIARTRSRAAEAKNAFPQPIELLAFFDRLRPLAVGRWGACGLQPGFDRLVLRDDMRQIGDQILDDRHVRQWIDAHRAVDVLDRLDAGERIGSVDIHGARAANPLTA